MSHFSSDPSGPDARAKSDSAALSSVLRPVTRIRWSRAVIAASCALGVSALGVSRLWSAAPAPAPASGLPQAVEPAHEPALAPTAKAFTPDTKAFLTDHCVTCHNTEEKAGHLDMTELTYDPTDTANIATWARIHDRLKNGEMPPKDTARPDPERATAFLKSMSSTIMDAERVLMGGEGRATQRRMNRYEYENALRDLLNLPMAAIKDKLPLDGEAYRYNKSAEALDVSFVQMQRFMVAADYALRLAMSSSQERPETTTRKIYARDLGFGYQPRENGTLPDRLATPVLDGRAQPEVRAGRQPNSSPETREREAVAKVSSIFSDSGSYSWGYRAPVTAKYRLKIAGYTVWVGGGGIARWFYEGQGNAKAPVYYLPLWHRPNLDEVWPGRTEEPMAVFAQSSGQTRQVGVFNFKPEPGVAEVEIMLSAGESIQTDATRFFRTRVNGTDEQYVNPLAERDGMPGYAVQWMEVEGPIYDETPQQNGYQLMFGNLALKPVENGNGLAGVVFDTPAAGRGGGGGRGAAPGGRGGRGGRGGAVAGGGGGRQAWEVETANPDQDAERLLRNFMQKAYRHPVQEADVQRFLSLYKDQYGKGFGFAKSMITAYTAVLSSPGFVFLQERPGKLDDYALATRLSMFLWNTIPDDTLRALAEKGELSKPEVLRAQTERMLKDAKSKRFVEAFTDYWLDLRKIDDTSPSTTLYNDYDMDDALKWAAMQETQLFFNELVQANLPVKNIVKSDFTFLNGRLAQIYKIPGVTGAEIRKVQLPEDSLRGGFMTQSSILKVTANGTTTSPVIRGHWITERILGIETQPPPPAVKAVEPDIRGAVTIRQQLDKHRADPSCASCHTIMDPPGFALESFDVMGGLRERYRAVSETVKPVFGFGVNGQAFQYHYGLPVDTAGTLPDGRPFKDVRELKDMLVKDEVPLARNMVKQLSIYATGAPVRFSDHDEIERIVQKTSPSHYGVRDIIHEIVQSNLFQTK